MAHDVFISYSTSDKKLVEGLSAYLEQNGIRCWIAYRDIPPGCNWADYIPRAIEDCRVMVYIHSETSNASIEIDKEIALCLKNGHTIIPFWINEIHYQGSKSYHLETVHWIDAFPNPEEKFGRLLESIESTLKKEQSVGRKKQTQVLNATYAEKHNYPTIIWKDLSLVKTRSLGWYILNFLLIAVLIVSLIMLIANIERLNDINNAEDELSLITINDVEVNMCDDGGKYYSIDAPAYCMYWYSHNGENKMEFFKEFMARNPHSISNYKTECYYLISTFLLICIIVLVLVIIRISSRNKKTKVLYKIASCIEVTKVRIKLINKAGKYGLYDWKKKRVLLAVSYDTIERQDDYYFIVKQDNKYGIFGLLFNDFIVPCEYDVITPFKNNISTITKGDVTKQVDVHGNVF